ncbi:MAG: bifunctional hydroxymethylpyrimidine kinase/phosphomethylpyrimidine kinase [Campylobacteraceae bacterium]|jgi:hydroxymethylpyrimidine/phosphomethylpyrimidine kinase|nr:bifunctional hydroxymethylpyrimidine kinase/phosphomethylpyrimidine kinase [Campylobacteraceae bacterium]
MKTVLTIAGSDSGGGAGIQADIKTAEAHGVFAASAITALTAQNTQGVAGVLGVKTEFIIKQIETVLSDFDISAVKIGMLGNYETANALADILKNFGKPIVLDPVAISRAGSKLLDDDAKTALTKLFTLADIVTPNHFEAEYFGLCTNTDAKLPKCNFLIKNIFPDSAVAVDRLFLKGSFARDYETPFAQKANTHGSGCTYSMAITCNLALGFTLDDAIQNSKNYIYNAIKNAPDLGHGNGPIRHKTQTACE